MTKPSSKPEWATDGGALIADPGTPKRHAGFVVDEAPPAHWFNWLFNNNGEWIEYLSNLHNESDFLGEDYDWTGAHTIEGALHLDDSVQIDYPTKPARTSVLDLHHAIGPERAVFFDGDGCPIFPAAYPIIRVPFRVPAGATLQSVTATVAPGSVVPTMTLKLKARGKSGTGSSAVQVGATDTRSGASTTQVLSVSGLTEVATLDTFYWLEVTSDGSSGTDHISKCAVTWLDPGPKSQVL